MVVAKAFTFERDGGVSVVGGGAHQLHIVVGKKVIGSQTRSCDVPEIEPIGFLPHFGRLAHGCQSLLEYSALYPLACAGL